MTENKSFIIDLLPTCVQERVQDTVFERTKLKTSELVEPIALEILNQHLLRIKKGDCVYHEANYQVFVLRRVAAVAWNAKESDSEDDNDEIGVIHFDGMDYGKSMVIHRLTNDNEYSVIYPIVESTEKTQALIQCLHGRKAVLFFDETKPQ